MKHIKDYFTPTKWRTEITEDFVFKAKNNYISVTVEPSHAMYEVKIEAEDDPSDSTHETTDEPLDVITEFFGKDVPGGDVFKQRASINPNVYAVILRRIASGIGQVKNSHRIIRRMIILPNFNLISSMIDRYAKTNPADFRMENRMLNNFKDEAKQKGWKFEITDDEPPNLHMEVYGFDVKVGIDTIMYDCEFELNGYPDSIDKVQAEDPVKEYQQWIGSEKFKEAVKEWKADLEMEENIPTKKPD